MSRCSGLTRAVADRAHFDDAVDLVGELTRQGLLDVGRLTRAGRQLVAAVQAKITHETAPIWSGLPEDDIAATTRLLNEVVTRARLVLGSVDHDATLVPRRAG